VSGIVALGASEQAADMLGDLKVRAGILHAGQPVAQWPA
jgi:hypothetical protein